MTTWRRGREILAEKLAEATIPMRSLLELLSHHEPPRVEGTAVYLTRHNELAPNALLHNLKHNKVLHERIVLLTVETVGVPRVDPAERVRAEQLRPDVIRLFIRYGFMERPDIPQALTEAGRLRLAFDPLATSFFLGRETLIPAINPPMSKWRERLFILMSRNAVSATDFFRIPPDRVVELGTQVPI